MTRKAVYPGTFDPPTLGHIDIIERASKMFDELIVAVGVNQIKNPLLDGPGRVTLIQESVRHIGNVNVCFFDGLLIDFAIKSGAQNIVRGLRAISDFEYEFQMAMVNRRLSEKVDTIFLMTKWEYSYLSSSIVREVANLGGDVSQMVPEPVLRHLQSRQ